MEVFGYCHSCGKQFDAHWHNYKEGNVNPYCLYCKSYDIHIRTDEDYEPIEDDGGYEDED